MDNQHRKIKGYRELSQAEIDLMNQIKTKGAELQNLLAQVDNHLSWQADAAKSIAGTEAQAEELNRLRDSQPQRWVAISRTHFQEGLMALTRAVAQPTFF